MIDPKTMCNKHLFGEHVECHMFVGTINKKKSLKGYVKNNLVEITKLHERHNALSLEIARRGYNHKSPLLSFDSSYLEDKIKSARVNSELSLADLHNRCEECKKLFNTN